jgi:chemotaxis protein CheX
MALDNGIMTSFACAAQEVMKFMLDADEVDGVGKESEAIEDGVNVTIGLTGDVAGETSFYFPRSTALSIVRIMSGMEFDDIDDFVTSAVGELSNIISGNAATALAGQRIACDILPPRITVGGAPAAETPRTISTTLNTTAGRVDLVVNPA